MDSLSAANGSFALNLFRKLSEDNKCNLFFSPLSISSALAMVCLGTKGNTAAQMSQVLQFNKAKNIPSDFQALISDINKPDTDYLLRTANRLYGEKSFTFLNEFLESTLKYYHADLQSVDFYSQAEDCRKEINAWVEQKTEGKIQNLLPSGTVDSLTRLVLVNAIYFKGNWANQFDKALTREMPFRINKNETKPVQMMYKKAKYWMSCIHDLFTKVIEIPYVKNELSMIILLPDDIKDSTTGLEKLEKAITHENFLQWTRPEMMDLIEMELYLPKFKLEDLHDLKSVLVSMGMSDAFDEGKADFSAMSANNELVLSKVIHKSFVEVNEEGTEAAAATAGIMMMRCAMMLEKELTISKFMEWTNPEIMDKSEVKLFLPKFKLEDNYDLESALISMGMSDAFDVEKSDFSGMSGSRDLVLSKVVHKSFVEVNEEGTEAAAATGAVVMLRSMRFVPQFICDHPFIFAIIHRQSQSILFLGRFCRP